MATHRLYMRIDCITTDNRIVFLELKLLQNTFLIILIYMVGWNHPPIKLNKTDTINGVWFKPSHCRDSCLQVQRGIRSGLLSKHILYASNFQWSVSVIRHEEVNPKQSDSRIDVGTDSGYLSGARSPIFNGERIVGLV